MTELNGPDGSTVDEPTIEDMETVIHVLVATAGHKSPEHPNTRKRRTDRTVITKARDQNRDEAAKPEWT